MKIIERKDGFFAANRLRAFAVLRDSGAELLSIHELSARSGIPYSSLKSQLLQWYRWGYIGRRVCKVDSQRGTKLAYKYGLTAKGLNYLEKMSCRGLNLGFEAV